MTFDNSQDIEVNIRLNKKEFESTVKSAFQAFKEGFIDGAKKASQEFDNVEESAKKSGKAVENAAKNATRGFSAFQTEIITANQLLDLTSKAVRGIQIAFNSLQEGSALVDIRSSLDALATKAGTTGEAITNQLRTAVDGTIADFDLMKQATDTLNAGLSPDALLTMTQAARALGDQLGISTTKALDTLNEALIRGNERALVSARIFIDREKAERDFAASIGTTADKLNEAGKKEAFRTAALEAMRKKTEEVGTITADAGDRIDQLTAQFENNKNKLFESIALNKTFNELLEKLTGLLANIDFSPLVNGLEATAGVLKQTIGLGESFIDSFVNNLGASFRKSDPGFKLFDQQLTQVFDNIQTGTKESVQAARVQFDELAKIISNPQLGVGLSNAFQQDIKNVAESLKVVEKQLGLYREAANQTTPAVAKLGTATTGTTASTAKLNASLRDTYIKLDDVSKKAKEAGKDLQSIDDGVRVKKADVSSSDVGSFDITSQITEGLKSQFQDLSDTTAGIIADSLISSFQTAFDLLATAISGGQIDTSQLVSNLTSTIGAVIGESFGGPAGAQIGQFAGTLVGTLVNGLIEHFNSDTPGTTARKAADKFFADVFDANRLAIVVGDQLKEVTDLVFKGDTPFGGNADFASGGFDEFLTTLPANVQAGLKGVGAAFEELLGIGEDVAGQLAAVIANNIGGELNNLQLLVEATGKSFDELHNAVVEAFLDGKLSIEEAQIALEGLQQVSQAGIPGAIGDIAQAFRNLQAAASSGKGSRALVDAIRDIGIEAQEVGVRDLPTLANRLVQVFGFSAQQVANFFQAMKATGINSLQELANAGTEVAIALASNLQAITEGKDPTATPVIPATTSTPTGGSGIGRSTSGTKQKTKAQQEAEAKKKQQEQERKRLIQEALKLAQASETYRQILDSVTKGVLSQEAASSQLNKLYASTHETLKKLNEEQDKYNKALQAGNATSEQAKKIQELQAALDALTEKAKKAVQSINLDFLKDFAGNLNAIGLTATELGITLEDTQERIVNAFKAGKTSIAQANAELKQTQDLLTAGIPGATGATKEAFENILKGGINGGAFSLDAFKDVFAEAQEKFTKGLSPARNQQFKTLTADFEGLKVALNEALNGGPQSGESRTDFDARVEQLTRRFQGAKKALDDFYETVPQIGLEDLRTILLQDIDPNLVNTFFQGLSDSGLNTFGDLANASDSVIIGILNRLGELGLPFQETSNEINDLNRQIADLTQDRNANITFTVNTKFADEQTQNIIGLVYGDFQGINTSIEPATGGLTAEERVTFGRLSAKRTRKPGSLTKDERAIYERLRRKARG